MGEWKPIESAPKDGETILCYWGGLALNPRYAVDVAAWNDDLELWVDPETQEEFVSWPTHWMPLPPPPQES